MLGSTVSDSSTLSASFASLIAGMVSAVTTRMCCADSMTSRLKSARWDEVSTTT